MTFPQHTPGPWTVESDQEGLYVRMEALADKDEFLAIYASPEPSRRTADALLIAAAPDLLAVCKATLEALGETAYTFFPNPAEPTASVGDMLYAAINKAIEGDSSERSQR